MKIEPFSIEKAVEAVRRVLAEEVAEVYSDPEVVVWNNGNVGPAMSTLKTDEMEIVVAYRRREDHSDPSSIKAKLVARLRELQNIAS